MGKEERFFFVTHVVVLGIWPFNALLKVDGTVHTNRRAERIAMDLVKKAKARIR